MRVNHNVASMITQGSLFKVNRDMGKSLEKLSTGLRINTAADDAAGLGVSENLRTQVKGTSQAIKNAQDGIAAISIAEGAANEISEILQRMRELGIQSSNDTLTSTERGYTDAEYQHLILEIDRIAGVTNYNGMELISAGTGGAGSRFGLVTAVAGSGSALWVDANTAYGVDSITITMETLTTAQLGVNSGTLIASDLSTQANSVNAVSTLDEAISSVNSMRSNMGAFVNRLEHAINNLQISNTNQQSAESQIRDVDFSIETANFTKNQILTQSATAMLSQANMLPQSVLSLLK